MHAPLRRCVISGYNYLCARANYVFLALRGKSGFVKNWTDALRLSVADKNGFFLIVVALVIFDYINTYIFDPSRIANFLHGGAPSWPDEITWRYRAAYFAFDSLTYVGYALFGWLAFERAQGKEFSEAARFSPRQDLVLFFIFTTAIDVLAASLAPLYLFGAAYLASFESITWIAIARTILFSTAFIAVSAYLLFKIRRPTSLRTVLHGIIGYLVIIHAIQIYQLWFRAPLDGMAALIFVLSKEFFVTFTWTIAYVALCALLGRSVLRKTD